MVERDEFLRRALAAGCPEDQVRNFIAARVYLQARQLAASAAARLCDQPGGPTAVGFGGAAVKVNPPLIIDEPALREGLAVLRDIMKQVA